MLLILSPFHYGSCSLMNQKNLLRVHHQKPTNWKLYLLEFSVCGGLRRKVDHYLLCGWSSSTGSLCSSKRKTRGSDRYQWRQLLELPSTAIPSPPTATSFGRHSLRPPCDRLTCPGNPPSGLASHHCTNWKRSPFLFPSSSASMTTDDAPFA
ncbi:unnamed protein product [Lactuca saligna]|uniref:Uncharacterized protein n=1 Tax=Lactuca saligna TaxID=75948 RepID=A0AA36A4I5_LACSI|nr:unnamed protein product [Lactuca saligna]